MHLPGRYLWGRVNAGRMLVWRREVRDSVVKKKRRTTTRRWEDQCQISEVARGMLGSTGYDWSYSKGSDGYPVAFLERHNRLGTQSINYAFCCFRRVGHLLWLPSCFCQRSEEISFSYCWQKFQTLFLTAYEKAIGDVPSLPSLESVKTALPTLHLLPSSSHLT